MKRYLGSTIVIVVGVLSIVAGLNSMANNQQDNNFFVGTTMVLGGLAYKSAKKRYLLETPDTSFLKLGEAALLAISLALLLLQNHLWLKMAYQPITYIIAPVWALVAYAIITLKKRKTVL